MEQGWSRDALQAPTVLAQSLVVTNGAAADVVSSYNYNAPISGPMMSRKAIAPSPPLPSNGTGTGAGIGAGSGGGMGGGTYRIAGGAESGSASQRPRLSPEMRALASKVSPQLLASYECWEKLTDKSAASSCHVNEGRLTVEIVVVGGTSAAKLSAAGFEANARQAVRLRLRGSIAINRLPQLSQGGRGAVDRTSRLGRDSTRARYALVAASAISSFFRGHVPLSAHQERMGMKRITVKAGDRFNSLVAVEFVKRNERGQAYWLFQCDCGNQKVLHAARVTSANTKQSCGCARTHRYHWPTLQSA